MKGTKTERQKEGERTLSKLAVIASIKRTSGYLNPGCSCLVLFLSLFELALSFSGVSRLFWPERCCFLGPCFLFVFTSLLIICAVFMRGAFDFGQEHHFTCMAQLVAQLLDLANSKRKHTINVISSETKTHQARQAWADFCSALFASYGCRV